MHIRKLLILLASQVSCEALRIKRPQVRILLGAPQTADKLRAVGGCFYSFVFLSIVWFLIGLSRVLASFKEVEARDFLLCFGTKFQVVFGDKTCLSQKVSQTRLNNIRLSLVVYSFFEARYCHKNCHKAVKLPAMRSLASMIFSSLF